MNFKLFLFIFVLITIKSVLTKSFTLVLDTTVSMVEEIDVIKRNLPAVTNKLRNGSDFEDFIIVPFNDPDVGTPIISSNPEQMLASLRGLTINGGHDCPEDSLSGIQKALELSKPESIIYVFTDAYSKDDSKFQSIEALCSSTRSQVVIFLSGSCYVSGNGQQGSVDVYYDVAKSCSGQLFRFDVISLRKAFKYIEEMVTKDWNDVSSYGSFTGYKQVEFSADTFTRDILVAVSGDYPSLQIIDGQRRSADVQKIVDARQALVVRVANFRPGIYQASIMCEGVTSLTVYKRNRIPFEYGFSTRVPRSLRETSLRPIPGWVNYILIVLSPMYNIQITSLELKMAEGDDKQTLNLNESNSQQGFYLTSVFMEPDKSFRCVIHGRDSTTYEEISGSSRIVDVQKPVRDPMWSKPSVEIIQEDILAEFGKSFTLACKVRGYPKSQIEWRDESDIPVQEVSPTEEIILEMPSTYISYVTVNATSNSTVCCKATNAKGEDAQCSEYYVNRPFTFDVVESPKDETFEYGTEGRLVCKADAYPEVAYKWYHNDSSVEYSSNVEIRPEDNALVIKNMTLEDIGSYKCKVTNSVETKSFVAKVTISGLEAPTVEIEDTEVILSPGDYKTIMCRTVKGNPTPVIAWNYLVDDYVSDVPSEVFVEEGQLKIPAAKIEHKGTYRCSATNMMGEDYREVSVKIQYAPKITSTDDGTLIVMEGDLVELPCDVDAIPKATVRWEVTQDDVIVALDERHATNDRNTHRFYALWKDSGNYHCIAENVIGKTERSVTVNVQVTPFIQPPQSTLVEVPEGGSITLSCNVLFGNPVPTTKWEFIAYDSRTTVLSTGNRTQAQLHLNNISRANEGMYLCIADNQVGNDRIRVNLKLK